MAILVSVSAVSATDYYVNGSASSSGNGLSWDQAFQTIGQGETAAIDGDKVFIAPGTYTGTTNTGITIDHNITIQGSGEDQTIIDCQNSGRAFIIQSGKNVTMKDLTIQNGRITLSDGNAILSLGNFNAERCTFKDNHGHNAGAIENHGTSTLNGCTFTGNTAVNGAGAIHNLGTLTINGSTFNSNTAGWAAGAIYNSGTCIITSSNFNGNTAGSLAGAIYNGNTLTITGSTFANNHANVDAGAILNYNALTLTDCSFTDNAAVGNAGAILNWATCTVTGCMFTGNTATYAGAIYNRDGTLTVTGCNIAGNSAYQGGAFYNWSTITAHFNRIVGNIATNSGSAIYNSGFSFDAENNWWGSNTGPNTANLFSGSVDADPWLILNINADPLTIYTGETSKIIANVYTDSNGVDHSGDAAQFFSGPEVIFTTDLGNIGSKTVTVPWTFGLATATLSGDEGPGIATVTAADVEILSTTVNILQAPVNPDDDELTPSDPVTPTGNEVNAATNTTNTTSTVGMQETGVPLAALILAILAVFSGLLIPKRK